MRTAHALIEDRKNKGLVTCTLCGAAWHRPTYLKDVRGLGPSEDPYRCTTCDSAEEDDPKCLLNIDYWSCEVPVEAQAA